MSDSAEDQIVAEAEGIASRLAALTPEPYFREAVVKMAVREIAWAFFDAFPTDRTALAEQFELMAGLIESKAREGGEAEADAR